MAQFYDTLLGEYIKNPGATSKSLDKIASTKFGYQMKSYDDITQKKKLNFQEVDLKSASIYSGEDVYITNKIFQEHTKEQLTKNTVLKDIETPLIQVLKDMEINGVKIDKKQLKSIGTHLQKHINTLEEQIQKDAGTTLNISSPKQVGTLLFEQLGLPKGKKTKTGYSVSAEVLNDLAHDFPIAKKIVTYRHYSKILSTYINGLTDLLDTNDLLHTSYNQSVTTTGRLSSTNPNLQNIPMGEGIAGEVRNAFISRFKNGHILAFDYSQIEIRILAIISKDQNLIKAFENQIDIHENTAKLIGTQNRKIAKAVNFGIIYGISPFGLSKMINIPLKEASQYIEKFFESYQNVKTYLNNTIQNAEQKGYVKTIFGRKRYITGINDSNQIIKKSAQREAINMPIQGTNADIIKIAMIQISQFLKTQKLQSKLIMQVHDELVFDAYPGEEDILKKQIKHIMENILTNAEVNLKVDIGMGKTWKEAK